MDTLLYGEHLKGALRGKRTEGNIYVLNRDGRVLQGNGHVEVGALLLEALGVSQTERAELSLHLLCGGHETVLLCAKRRPVFVFCGLYACAGLLVVYVPRGTACLDASATLAPVLEDLVVGSDARGKQREVDADLLASVTAEYALLQAVTGRGICTPTARLEAISRLTGCGIGYDLTPFDRSETEAVLLLQAIVLLAAFRTMSVGARTLALCTVRDRARAVLSLEARDKMPDATFEVFDDIAGMARERGDLFVITRDAVDPCTLHLTATLTRAELSFQGVKEPDGFTRGEPIPMPIALKGEDGELVL